MSVNEALFQTAAPAFANLTMSMELVMGVVLIFGAWMAHRRLYNLHAWCQSLIVVLNLIVIAIVMVPSFNTSVRPRIPEKLGHSFYALATTHAILASVAEVAALYMMLAAGTQLLPPQLRPANLKIGMR